MLIPIGRFARRTGLSIKALRHYDEIGLLKPARVDPRSGYRLYDRDQVDDGVRLRRLRELDLPLSEIARVLADGDERAILAAHLERIEARVERDSEIAGELRETIGADVRAGPANVLFRIEVKEIPEQDMAAIAARVPVADVGCWLRDAFAELFAAHAERGTGPPQAILPPADEEDMIAGEAMLPVAGAVAAAGRIRPRRLPACRALVALYQGPHDELPELYRALAGAIDDQGVEPAGEPREVYLASPGDTPDRSVSLVELVWPIDVPAGWRPHERLFTEPLRG